MRRHEKKKWIIKTSVTKTERKKKHTNRHVICNFIGGWSKVRKNKRVRSKAERRRKQFYEKRQRGMER